MSFYFIFTKANVFFKILLPYLFLDTFLSLAPHLSMSSFIWVTLSAYFYLLCLEIEDWTFIFKVVWCILMLEFALVILGAYHKETLLNFGKEPTLCLGTVGNPMQFNSLIILLFAMLIQGARPTRKCVVAAYCAFALLIAYFIFKPSTWNYFLYARGGVWWDTIRLSFNHPIIGHGLGTFQKLFDILAYGHYKTEGIWENAHNEFLQLLFEAGLAGFLTLVSYGISLLIKCRGILLVGVLLVGFSMSVHFPMHQNSTCLLLILFAAYLDQKTRRQKWQTLPDLK